MRDPPSSACSREQRFLLAACATIVSVIGEEGDGRQRGICRAGHMGGPMALNLVKAGFELVVHDINSARLEPLVAAGATVETSPEAVAARCHRTICMVETTAQAEAVILGRRGITHAAKQGDTVLCLSDIDPIAGRRTR